MLDYFFKKINNKKLKLPPSFYISKRKNRPFIKGSILYRIFTVGDILDFVYFYRSLPLIFKGIFISIRKKNFMMPDVIITLRNVIMKVGLELTVSFFYNRLYKLRFLDYKRKFYNFSKNKIFFIRKRVNRASKVD